MPDLSTHKYLSRIRLGCDYESLHRWIDFSEIPGVDHRCKRHSPSANDIKYVEERWGKKGVSELFFHIYIDYKETYIKWNKKHGIGSANSDTLDIHVNRHFIKYEDRAKRMPNPLAYFPGYSAQETFKNISH